MALQAQARVEAWVNALGVGGQNHIGLLPEIERESNLVSAYLREETETGKVQLVTPDKEVFLGRILPGC